MKLVFFGTPKFAIPSFYALHKSKHRILALVTTPDKRSGRGQKVTSSPIKEISQEFKYPVYQPASLADPQFIKIIQNLDPDIFIVVAFRILPDLLISIPSKGAINLHASLLPKYRGASPIHHAIINGDIKTGVTTFRIQSKVDTGDILLQKNYKLDNMITAGEVYDNLASLGAKLMITTLDLLKKDQIVPIKQEHKKASLAPKISTDNCQITWDQTATMIHNQIRAFSPQPGAFTYLNDKRIKLFKSEIKIYTQHYRLKPGEIYYDNNILKVGTVSDVLHIHEVQLEGKKRMAVNQFISGFPIIKGDYFESQ